MNILELVQKCNYEFNSTVNNEEKEKAIKPFLDILNNFIKEINNQNEDRRILLVDEKTYSDIFKPNEQISDSYLSTVHFNLDDIDIYKEFLKFFLYELITEPKENISFKDIIMTVQKFIINVFGPLSDWFQLFIYFGNKEKEKVSIKELYNKNLAVCIERTAFAHNLLKLLGLDDTVVSCEVSYREQKKYNYLGHVVNATKFNNVVYIVDYLNCSQEWTTIDESTKIVSNIIPSIVELTNEEYEEFLNEKRKIKYSVIINYDNSKTKRNLTAYTTKVFRNNMPSDGYTLRK